ncbi:MAG: type II toxin-antitoxin system RelE/ParE family toxin [Nitrosomonas sp.]|nr:type II toxin-antitoxin system RelE/ParE family toxin [Nitrosomonas sp.]MCC7091010.1 type II toxin-antitoxin system RelE/ParE family toxin [Nitrosomonas sp.]
MSYEWYQNQAEGLGDDFLHELELAYQTLTEFPETWPKFRKNYRRFLLRKFPFSVLYRLQAGTIFVVAVMHNSRKPGYWKDRVID